MATRSVDNDLYAWAAANASKSYVPNGLNQYGSISGTNYGYDLNGNLTSDGSSSYSYDPLGRIFQ